MAALPAAPTVGSGPPPDVPVPSSTERTTCGRPWRTRSATRRPALRSTPVPPATGHSALGADLSGCAERAFARFLGGGRVQARCRRARRRSPAAAAADRAPTDPSRPRSAGPRARDHRAGANPARRRRGRTHRADPRPRGPGPGPRRRVAGGALPARGRNTAPARGGLRARAACHGRIRRFGERRQRGRVRSRGRAALRGILTVRGSRVTGRLGARRARLERARRRDPGERAAAGLPDPRLR